MSILNWYYPQTPEEAALLVQRDGMIPCGGGTMLLRSAMTRTRGFIDLRHLHLGYFNASSQSTTLGATLTYSETVEKMASVLPDSIIGKALHHAASTPLRNVITLGGSLAAAPPWSDLLGPLVALEAEVELIGQNPGNFSVTDYLGRSELREKSLMVNIRFANAQWESYYYRGVRTSFDLPSLTITILAEKTIHGQLKNIRIVLVGTREKYQRLQHLEQQLVEERPHLHQLPEFIPDLLSGFAGRRLGSAEFMARLAGIELQRGLEKILREV
ncbi:MAG: FAD binding domain-containing protein [Acidobacteria bacterium]|nr:FAD binding domain-containing protein [Acidobacteriota bacterium]